MTWANRGEGQPQRLPGQQGRAQEAQETEQLMLRTSSKEQPDVLRRITVARSRIYTQRHAGPPWAGPRHAA